MKLPDKKTILFDGAIGTELIKQGLTNDELPDFWNLTKPDEVASLVKGYNNIGVDVFTTNTLNASSYRLKNTKFESKQVEIIYTAVKIIKNEISAEKLIAGSIGPSGLSLVDYKIVNNNEVFVSYQKQGELLQQAGVDLLIFETFYNLEELIIAHKAVSKLQLPIILSMTFINNKGSFQSYDTTSPELFVHTFETEPLLAIGSNCNLTASEMLPLAEEFQKYSALPLMMQPIVEEHDNISSYQDDLENIIDLGVKFIGGCCGSNVQFIKTLKFLIENKI